MNSIGCKSSQLGSVHKGAVFVIQQTTTRVSSRLLLVLKLGRENGVCLAGGQKTTPSIPANGSFIFARLSERARADDAAGGQLSTRLLRLTEPRLPSCPYHFQGVFQAYKP
jgi:hypothetical protein